MVSGSCLLVGLMIAKVTTMTIMMTKHTMKKQPVQKHSWKCWIKLTIKLLIISSSSLTSIVLYNCKTCQSKKKKKRQTSLLDDADADDDNNNEVGTT